jgi:hypothetical protein
MTDYTFTCCNARMEVRSTTNRPGYIKRYRQCSLCGKSKSTYETDRKPADVDAQNDLEKFVDDRVLKLLDGRVEVGERIERNTVKPPPFPTTMSTCPDCATTANVKMTTRRPEGYFRRMKCPNPLCRRNFILASTYDGQKHKQLPSMPMQNADPFEM